MSLTDLQSLAAIKQVLTGDNKNHTGSIFNSLGKGSDTDKTGNSIKAVSDLLKNLLDPGSAQVIQDQIRAKSNVAKNLQGISAGIGSELKTKYVPSYNVRTPVVTLAINGYTIYPYTYILDTTTTISTQTRLNFQSLNLKLPMGGVEKSVQGSVSIFTKNPEEILNYTESWATQADADKSMNGLPILSLTFGWAFSDTTQQSNPIQQVNTTSAMSPTLRFAITNIKMDDPGAAGTTFTFTLADIGTTILENSSDNLIIAANYPQQQIRTILEGIFRLRLFTLDDILYLGKNNITLPNTAAVTVAETVASDAGAGAKVQVNQAIKTALDTTLSSLSDAASVLSRPENVTFFSNVQNGDLSINNRNFLDVVNNLASQCRCKWYPHLNTAEAISQDNTINDNAINTLSNLSLDLKMVKSLAPNATLDQATLTSITSHLGSDLSNGGNKTSGGSVDIGTSNSKAVSASVSASLKTAADAEKTIIAALKENMARLASSCRLVWVQNVPANWKTSRSDYYTNTVNKNDATYTKPADYTEGAYFLLPDILTDYDIFSADAVVQYGPGASNMPYFYGSGQNVFQTSISGNQPEMFGEVLALNTDHSNMIAVLAQSVNQNIAYGVEGQHLTGLQLAQGFTSNPATKPTPLVADSKLLNEGDRAAFNKAADAASNGRIKGSIYNSPTVSKWKNSLGIQTGPLLIADDTSMSGKNRSVPTSSDEGGGAETAALKIRSRVANFLRFPTATKITVLGDPNLLRLGPGCFELFSYYPVEQPDGTIIQKLNALTSGVYFVTSIEHNITMGDFTTTLNGSKIIDPLNVPSSLTNKIRNKIAAEINSDAAKAEAASKTASTDTTLASAAQNLSKTLSDQFDDVNLNDPNFTKGFLSVELQNTLTTYKTLK